MPRFPLGPLALALTLLVPAPAVAEWRQTSFLIGGWCPGFTRGQTETLLALDGAGFDYVQNIEHAFSDWPSHQLVATLDSLAAARPEFRLRAILHYGGIGMSEPGRFARRLDGAAAAPAILANLAPGRGMNGRSVLGWGLWDEPSGPEEMSAIHALTTVLRESPSTRDGLPYVNLLPIYVCPMSADFRKFYPGPCADAYARYLDDYLGRFDADPTPAPLLSFDHYPEWSSAGRRDYFVNLGLAMQAAQRHARAGVRIPLWVVVQLSRYRATGQSWQPGPSFARTRWQAWCAVAYGAKSVSYWTVGPVFDDAKNEGWGPGVIGFDHRPTDRLPEVAALNRELHAIGPKLMRLESVGVFQQGDPGQDVPDPERPGAPANPYGLVRRIEGDAADDALIGYLKDPKEDADYLLVVNKSLERSRAFRLTLDGVADTIVAYDVATGRPGRVATGTDRLETGSIPPASGRLYRLVTPLAEHLLGVTAVRTSAAAREYMVGGRWLRVDRVTGARKWIERPVGAIDSAAKWTAVGVLRGR